jgi:hypothetical protein
MRISLFIGFFLNMTILLPGVVFAQIQRPGGLQQQPQADQPQADQPAEKQIDPEIKLWYLNGYGAFKDSTCLDTIQDFFHLYHPAFKNTITTSYLGNYANPYLDNNFFNRSANVDFFFLQTREAYLLTPQSVKYYNTRTPYTLLDYTQSEHHTRKNETRFNVLHTQNVNPYLNFTFRYDQARSAGQYKNQNTKNNFITLYSNYDKDKLAIHTGFISNRILNNENGGIHENADLLNEPETDFLDVNLTSVKSDFANKYLFATGEYRFGRFIETAREDSIPESDEEQEETPPNPGRFKPFAGILYSFEFQTNTKEYSDEEDASNPFFQHDYFGTNYTKDSVLFRKISNIVQLKQYENPESKTSFGKRAFLGQELVKISLPGITMDTSFYQRTKRYSNVYAGGGIFRQTGRFWRWNFNGRIFLLGRNVGQTELSGVISKPLPFFGDSLTELSITGRIENRIPDYFQEEFYSKRIFWKNNLKMEQRMTVQGSLKIPSRNLELAGNYALINNFIYNDTLAVPSQFGGQLLVLSAYADKDFNLRNLHFRTRLLWQKVSNETVLHLPEFSAFILGYYKFVISKVMFTQVGFDVRYNSRYYADAYHPSTGLFYLQNDEKYGNFPYIDAYASLRLKRTRVFFKLINVGTEFIQREYFTTPGYPMNRMTFRLGVAWAFYD